VAVARARCLYCGAPLPEAAVEAAAQAAFKVREASAFAATTAPAEALEEPFLLILDVGGKPAAVLERALGLAPFEAEMRLRVGGVHLHRRGGEGPLREEAQRLEALGLSVFLFPEAEARLRIVSVRGGRHAESVLHLRTEDGPLTVDLKDLFLVVRGPIRREYLIREIDRKRPHTATLEEGYRFHLHRRGEPAPIELDPAGFAFSTSAPLTGSSLLELKAWLAALGDGVVVDDAFKRLPPALGEAAAGQDSLRALREKRSAGMAKGREAPAVLDNLAQFRFYSGWRAAVERRRRA
jgi:hypothetical protein